MSESYSKLTKQVGERITAFLERVQEPQISVAKRIRERLQNVSPRLAQIELPVVGTLPTPLAVARANFALAEQVLEAQKSYTIGLLDALAPRPRKPVVKAATARD